MSTPAPRTPSSTTRAITTVRRPQEMRGSACWRSSTKRCVVPEPRSEPAVLPSSSSDLVQDRRVLYLPVFCQQERLAQDYRQGAIAFEGQEYLSRKPAGRRSAGGHDAQVLVVRLHQYVAAAKVDLVRANVAPDDQEPLRQAATVRYLQSRDQALQHLLARPGRLGEVPERVTRPVVPEAALRP